MEQPSIHRWKHCIFLYQIMYVLCYINSKMLNKNQAQEMKLKYKKLVNWDIKNEQKERQSEPNVSTWAIKNKCKFTPSPYRWSFIIELKVIFK